MKPRLLNLCITLTILLTCCVATAEDWTRFRGPNGLGDSRVTRESTATIPMSWTDTENIRWKVDLPGPGASSPIVTGDKVLVTAYSGYGLSKDEPGDMSKLKRHLLCLDRTSGEQLWQVTVDPYLPEDPYAGIGVPEHGYASHTPVTDVERVYTFFGKSGVYAFDLDGNQLWHTNVGHDSDKVKWGSAASPILYKDLVIVVASDESHTIYALDKMSGEERWKITSDKFALIYGTPAVVEKANGPDELLIGLSEEFWALAPATGEKLWTATTPNNGAVSTSPFVVNDMIYFSCRSLRGSGTELIRSGGRGDVTESHIVWSTKSASDYPTPVLYDGRLYWIDGQGFATCINAETGEEIYRERMPQGSGNSRGKRFYGSPVIVGDKLVVPSRFDGIHIVNPTDTFELIRTNRFGDDTSCCNSTPTVDDEQMFIRTDSRLYCIGTVK